MKPYHQENGIVIYCGDCREILPSLEFSFVLTDPPYNAANIGPNKRVYENQVMKLSDAHYASFCDSWYREVIDKPLKVFTPGIANTHFYPQPKWQLCWHKPASVSFNRMGGFNAWEPVFVYGDTTHVRLGQDYCLFNTLNFNKGEERDHPCPKPLSLWEFLYTKFCREDWIVCDPFLGSGTTLVAAKLANRKAIGIDISERYCEIAAKRLSQEVFNFAS